MWRVLNLRWFCWRGERRKDRPSRQFSHCLFISLWATEGDKTHALRPLFTVTDHFPACLHLSAVVLLSAVQYTTCAGQRVPYAVVRGGIRLHSGLPEDDWWVGDTRPTCRLLPRCGTPAEQEETTAALSVWKEEEPRCCWRTVEEKRRKGRAAEDTAAGANIHGALLGCCMWLWGPAETTGYNQPVRCSWLVSKSVKMKQFLPVIHHHWLHLSEVTRSNKELFM